MGLKKGWQRANLIKLPGGLPPSRAQGGRGYNHSNGRVLALFFKDVSRSTRGGALFESIMYFHWVWKHFVVLAAPHPGSRCRPLLTLHPSPRTYLVLSTVKMHRFVTLHDKDWPWTPLPFDHVVLYNIVSHNCRYHSPTSKLIDTKVQSFEEFLFRMNKTPIDNEMGKYF